MSNICSLPNQASYIDTHFEGKKPQLLTLDYPLTLSYAYFMK